MSFDDVNEICFSIYHILVVNKITLTWHLHFRSIFYSHFLERAHTLAYCEGQEALKSWRSFRLQQAVAIPPRYCSRFFVQG